MGPRSYTPVLSGETPARNVRPIRYHAGRPMESASSRLSLPGRRVTSGRSALPPTVQIIASAVLVAVVYHLGARFGEQLRFLPVTTSVLWPPNAILTATLLLAAPRWWWVYLLAALPAHLLGQPP